MRLVGGGGAEGRETRVGGSLGWRRAASGHDLESIVILDTSRVVFVLGRTVPFDFPTGAPPKKPLAFLGDGDEDVWRREFSLLAIHKVPTFQQQQALVSFLRANKNSNVSRLVASRLSFFFAPPTIERVGPARMAADEAENLLCRFLRESG